MKILLVLTPLDFFDIAYGLSMNFFFFFFEDSNFTRQLPLSGILKYVIELLIVSKILSNYF